ncbi:hypothetical protein [Clostridium sp.]|uniref:hypothetical protein n=1 Tax=Clostridium sp. TaxID=1506 RepID=UPI002912C838|nr:hypothetical protein [Clostridium sp.]MDU7240421.1 hypothetical protein [Clostridium sp.]
MEIKNRLFPYPVLCSETDDYVKTDLLVKTDVLEGISDINLKFNIELNNEEMLDLIRMGYAEYVIHLECTSTAFRKALKTDVNQLSYSIQKDRVNNEITVLAMIVAKRKIDDFFSIDLNEDYEGEKITFEKASILAYCNLPRIYISKNYEELAGNDSLFSVIKIKNIDKDEEKPITFELNDDRIKILVDEGTYDSYIRFQQNSEIAMSLLVLPAIAYMIGELQIDYDSFQNKLWFIKIKQYFKSLGKDFREDVIYSGRNAIELAQEMLKYPIGKAYKMLFKQGE